MKRIASFLLGSLSLLAALAQSSQPGSSEILQSLAKLRTVGSVLYIAAHPDDENTRLLSYLSKERNVRTGYLSLTRGDGGQNLIGKEQGEPLGLVRTQELLAARRVDGAEQFFTRANDFGYSKNPEETFTIWNKDTILEDVVWAIRRFKPDVIICRFPTTGEGGHGHHTASAILALEAFSAAADPRRFPSQLAYTGTWQAKRLFWNTFNFGTTNTTSPDQLTVDVGGFNALLGKSYGEISAESRSMHKSQGFGSAKSRGSQLEYFKQLKGDSVKQDLFQGIDISWKRIPAAKQLDDLIVACMNRYDPRAPEKSVPALAAIYKALRALNDKDEYTRYWKQLKMKEAANLILACSGIWIEACAADFTGIPGRSCDMSVQVVSRSGVSVKLAGLTWPGKTDSVTSLPLKQNELYTFKHREALAESMPFSNPYWLNDPHEQGMYTVRNQLLIGMPENGPAATVLCRVEFNGLNLEIERGLVYKYTDPVKGEIYRPFEVLPPVTVNIPEKVYIFPGGMSRKVQFILKANIPNASGTLHVSVPQGWSVSETGIPFKMTSKGDETSLEVLVTPGNAAKGKLSASVETEGKTYSKSIRRIEYDHIPYQFILNDADAGLVNLDLKKGGLNIGYIPGAGDDVPASLRQAGYSVTILNDELLSGADLSVFSAIVTGIRAYNTNERLQVHYKRLMEYVSNGGNLVVQYNTNNRIGPLVAKIGPYPFTISRDRVTDENAEVRILDDKHVVLNSPNTITREDFEGWVQERGIYFASELDKNYETIFSMNDKGEKPSEGSLILARYGKGNFVYTGLDFFRELPAGVPGAYRLFANILALPSNR